MDSEEPVFNVRRVGAFLLEHLIMFLLGLIIAFLLLDRNFNEVNQRSFSMFLGIALAETDASSGTFRQLHDRDSKIISSPLPSQQLIDLSNCAQYGNAGEFIESYNEHMELLKERATKKGN